MGLRLLGDSLSASARTPLADVAGDRHPPFLGAHKLKRSLTKSQATWASVIPLLDLLFLLQLQGMTHRNALSYSSDSIYLVFRGTGKKMTCDRDVFHDLQSPAAL